MTACYSARQLPPPPIRPICMMRYSLHEIDNPDVIATQIAAARDQALEWFSEKLRLILTFEGDPADAESLLDEWPEGVFATASDIGVRRHAFALSQESFRSVSRMLLPPCSSAAQPRLWSVRSSSNSFVHP